jgi:hypothetical protein
MFHLSRVHVRYQIEASLFLPNKALANLFSTGGSAVSHLPQIPAPYDLTEWGKNNLWEVEGLLLIKRIAQK